MKPLLSVSILWVVTIFLPSCKKYETCKIPDKTVARTVQFMLYTTNNESHNQHNVSFKLFIENSRHEILWDSTLATMKAKEIPGIDNKIVVTKVVPGDDHSVLKAGFHYIIEDTGNAFFDKPVNPGETFKIIDFNFL